MYYYIFIKILELICSTIFFKKTKDKDKFHKFQSNDSHLKLELIIILIVY
jgi:hypothetical protein